MSRRDAKLMSPLAVLQLLVGAAAVYTAVTLAFTGSSRTLASAVLAVALVLVASGLAHNRRWRRNRWFHHRFRTYEQFRADSIDEARRVWDEKGGKEVVRHLRTLYPMLPNPHLMRLLQEFREG